MSRPPKKTTENAAAETKTAATKAAETKTAATKAAKPAAEKKAAKTATPKTEKKPAAKKTTTADATAKKTTAASKTTAKRTAKKPVTIDSICTKVEKIISKDKVAEIKGKIAVDIEVWGFEDGSKKMYIEINDGKATVAPYPYDEKDFRVSISLANAAAFADGKITLKELLDHEEFYAEGNVAKAVKLAAIF